MYVYIRMCALKYVHLYSCYYECMRSFVFCVCSFMCNGVFCVGECFCDSALVRVRVCFETVSQIIIR